MFVIPEDLGQFSVAGLGDLKKIAAAELATLVASVANPEDATDEQLDRGEALTEFLTTVDAEVAKRNDKLNRFANINKPYTQPEPTDDDKADDDEEDKDDKPAVVTAAAEKTEVLEGEVLPPKKPGVADIAPASTMPEVKSAPAPFGEYHTIVAAGEIPRRAIGGEFTSWDDLGKALLEKTRGYGSGNAKLHHSFAQIVRNYPEEFVLTESMSDEKVQQVLVHAANEKRLEGGSLVAAAGWCAPSETLYDTCIQVTSDGMMDLPEVVARRGGIRHNQGLDFSDLFGDDITLPIPGFNILTEAEVIADTAKTCVEIPCPTFIDERLNVAALCLTSSLLQNRGYPEFVSDFTQGAIAAFGHLMNRQIIAAVVTGSAAVTLAAAEPWASDGTVVSNVLHAVEHAITDIKYNLRLSRDASLDVVMPFWARHLFRADWSRRTGVDDPNVTDAMINSWFAQRGARVQWVYDWQDNFSGIAAAAGGWGAATPVTVLPTTVQFLIFPAGTWILARQDVIRLDTIYDSVNLAQNLVTQLFMEDGWLPMRMCPLSRVYTVPLCPSGATTALRAVDCVV